MVSEYLRELVSFVDLDKGIQGDVKRRRALEDRLKFEIQGVLSAFMEYSDWHSMAGMILDDVNEEERNEREELTNA